MQPPTGTVTLVFTDIEGSTQLWERHGDAFHQSLTAHNAIINEASRAHGGYVVKTEGDAFFLVFKRALDAAKFALEVQNKLPGIKLAFDDVVRVRIGIHAGEPLVEIDAAGRADYFGPAVNRAARIAAAGHGGQTLMSLGTAHAVRDELGAAGELTELGAFRLKGIEEPEFIFQLVSTGAAVKRFGPLRTTADNPTNLPAQTTTFVGREAELKTLRLLLLGDDVRVSEAHKPVESLARQPGAPTTGQITRRLEPKNRGSRLITLTGPGGCGKTRLAVALASDVLSYFPDGVWFADLAEAVDELALCETVMAALGNQLRPGKVTPAQQVAWAFEHRNCLLVLDTFERLTRHASVLALWLRTAPRLRLLVTSRELLRAEGEVGHVVEPLGTPDLPAGITPPPGSSYSIASFPSVQLFLERASQARPGFALTPDNTPSVAEICRKLEGMPLAIELAAARLNVLTPQQLLGRLNKGFDVVASRGRDRHSRQTNLHDAIQWSYSLLDVWERTVLLQLSVFAGAFTLESAEEILDMDPPLDAREGEPGAPPDVMDVIFGLRDKSLLSLKGDDDRYLFEMLGSVREFAGKHFEELAPEPRRQALYRRHAEHFTQRMTALRKLFDNSGGFTAKVSDSWGLADGLQAASRALAAGRLKSALELSLGVFSGMEFAGRRLESQQRLQALMAELKARPGGLAVLEADQELRGLLALFYSKISAVTMLAGDAAKSLEISRSAIALSRVSGDLRSEIGAMTTEGLSLYFLANREAARERYEAALKLAREHNFTLEVGKLLSNFSMLHQQEGRADLMRDAAQEALNIFTKLNYRRGQAMAINNLGVALESLGDIKRAEELYRDSLKIKESLRDFLSAAQSRANIAQLAIGRLDFAEALEQLNYVIGIYRNSGDRPALGVCLMRAAVCRAGLGHAREANELAIEGISVLRETNIPARTLDGMLFRCCAFRLLGDRESARAGAEEALELAVKTGRKEYQAFAGLHRVLCLSPDEQRAELPKLRTLLSEARSDQCDRPLALLEALLHPDNSKGQELARVALERSIGGTASDFVDVVLAARKLVGTSTQ